MLSAPALTWRMVSNDATRAEALALVWLVFPADCALASPLSRSSSRPTPAIVVCSRRRRRGFVSSGMAVSPLRLSRTVFDGAQRVERLSHGTHADASAIGGKAARMGLPDHA